MICHRITLLDVFVVFCLCCFEKGTVYGSIFNDVGKYVESFGEVMNNVASGIETVIDGVRTVENVFNDAIEEDCEYKCRNDAQPKMNPYHVPKSNGCGSLGLQIGKDELPVHQMTDCCDDHDLCYDTCNEEKDDCDKRFKKCLYRICDKYISQKNQVSTKKCKAAAKFMYVGTTALGCKPYKNAQEKACLCERLPEKEL